MTNREITKQFEKANDQVELAIRKREAATLLAAAENVEKGMIPAPATDEQRELFQQDTFKAGAAYAVHVIRTLAARLTLEQEEN